MRTTYITSGAENKKFRIVIECSKETYEMWKSFEIEMKAKGFKRNEDIIRYLINKERTIRIVPY